MNPEIGLYYSFSQIMFSSNKLQSDGPSIALFPPGGQESREYSVERVGVTGWGAGRLSIYP
jgi:hypothetical protein